MNLPQGWYKVVWSVRLESDFFGNLNNVEMRVYPNTEFDASLVPRRLYLPVEDMVAGEWVDISHPSLVFQVNKEFEDVTVALIDHADDWKNNISIRSMHLQILEI